MSDHSQQLVVFSLGSEEYAAPITRVQEIIEYSEPRSVASDLPWIRGVISLRGKIVPVCDLAARIGALDSGAESKIVIVETASGMAGVIVDEVTEVLIVEGEQLDVTATADEELIEAMARVQDRLIVLLNVDGVFAGATLAPA